MHFTYLFMHCTCLLTGTGAGRGAAQPSRGQQKCCAGGRYQLPLAELGGDFYDELKSLSSGYASFDYAEGPMRRADLVRPATLVAPGVGVPASASWQSVERRVQETSSNLLQRMRTRV